MTIVFSGLSVDRATLTMGIRLTYWWPDPGTDLIVIDGEDFAGHRIHAWFTRMDPSSFPLVERGFNWVQEQPYNR